MSVTIGGEYFKHTATELEDRDIECTATEVEHGNLHILVGLVNTIGKGSRSRLINDTANIQSGNLSSFLGGLTLRVGEVGRHCDDSIRNFLSKVVLGGLLHLLKHHGRDFLRSVFAAVDVNTWITTFVDYREGHAAHFLLNLLPVFAHEALDTIDSVLGVGDGLTLCRVANLALTAFNKTNDRRSCALAFAVGYYNWFVALKYGNT